MMDPHRVRSDFPIFERAIGNSARHFLDSGASSQKPSAVIEAMSEFTETLYANVHRGAYRLSLESTERFELTRQRVAELLRAASADEVVLNRGATTGLNQVAFGWGAHRIKAGQRILLTTMEHHANLVPWQMVAGRTGATLDFVGFTEDFQLDELEYEAKLDDDVAIVAMTGMSNVLGTMPPVRRMSDRAHDVGAVVVIDGAQLVPHRPVDVSSLGADFLAFSAHKMLGPTGIGALWARPERLEEMEPIEGGGEMISNVTLEHSTWAPVPHRFEAGTPPIIEAVGFTAAIDYLDKIGMVDIAAHDRRLTAYALDQLAAVEGLTVYGPPAANGSSAHRDGPESTDWYDRGGVVSFTLGDAHPHDLATILDEHGVAVRAGHHCAKPLLRLLDVPATARASFYVYNDEEDVQALIAGLSAARALFGI